MGAGFSDMCVAEQDVGRDDVVVPRSPKTRVMACSTLTEVHNDRIDKWVVLPYHQDKEMSSFSQVLGAVEETWERARLWPEFLDGANHKQHGTSIEFVDDLSSTSIDPWRSHDGLSSEPQSPTLLVHSKSPLDCCPEDDGKTRRGQIA
mmetsp:Transcript_20929/g.55838  ORF Transcript_20929/g.55838 Transcript_20929/m.55838 type:complete len:148 (-) Transcript_20929:373-816(-)|eukprot:CAMPEP_0194515422 /NCGR_PEP_ID=MMETSP0253-20130528/48102_1 /TAXON_ID=2966 /ORGANISM="Noctiluca scintillans" /LENGTH=147 /DNA_ID=CAMNT_0039359169 /DNA_START=30 /DNA_END=473 /DNA_ORIENTATION=-